MRIVLVPRILTVAAAQLGPIQRSDDRGAAVARMCALLRTAAASGCDLVVFPELALTTFFPRWFMPDQAEIDSFFERSMPSVETQPLFDLARQLKIGFYLGYAELVEEEGHLRRFNTAILVDKAGAIALKYRKIHLPGHGEHEPWRAFQHLEKRYFEVGNLIWPVARTLGGVMGMAICNDRRWPETYRVMGLQGVEMVLIGYNTPATTRRRPTMTGCRSSTTTSPCRPVPIRTHVGGGRGQVRGGGGLRDDRRLRHHRPHRPDCAQALTQTMNW